MSILKVSEIQSNTTGAPPLIEDSTGVQVGTFCRAWVNFNGTGTVAIRSSFNVLGITDNGVGDYTINFATAMPDNNHAPGIQTKQTVLGNGTPRENSVFDYTTTAIRLTTRGRDAGANFGVDTSDVFVYTFR